MAEQGRHLTHRSQPCGRLQAFLAGARQLLDATLFADVQKRAHPAGLQALGVDQRGLNDEHGKQRAIFAHEDRLKTLARWHVACQPDCLALLVFINQGRWPVGRRQIGPRELFGGEADHVAERRVDVGGLAVKVARAQAGDQRVLHRFAERQRVREFPLGLQASADILAQ